MTAFSLELMNITRDWVSSFVMLCRAFVGLPAFSFCFCRSGLAFLDVFWQSLIWPCLHLVVNPLYLLSWSLLLIVDFDSDTSTSWRVFFTWLNVVKGFFFTMERILRSSTTVVLCGRPCIHFYVAELTSAFFFSSECTKLLIWPLRMFLLSLWWICFVFEA